MITINFPDLDMIVTFDGTVLEVFNGDESRRVHIGHIKRIQVTTDRKSKQTLHVETIVGEIPYMPFEQPVASQVNDLVAAVQQAIGKG